MKRDLPRIELSYRPALVKGLNNLFIILEDACLLDNLSSSVTFLKGKAYSNFPEKSASHQYVLKVVRTERPFSPNNMGES